MAVYTVNTMKEVTLDRFSSGDGRMDWLLGSKHDGFGFVRGGLSLWGGESGVGKTRGLVGVCKTTVRAGKRVLWFQIEQPLGLFKAKYLNGQGFGANFLFSNSSCANKMMLEIRKYQPDLVVVDSINKIDQYRGSDQACKALEKAFRNCLDTMAVKPHLAFITHLNAEGTIKGGTMLPHMVDTVLQIEWYAKPLFTISIPNKNRFGETGDNQRVLCAHYAEGVRVEKTFPEHTASFSKRCQEALADDVIEETARPDWHYLMIPVAAILWIPLMIAAIMFVVMGVQRTNAEAPYVCWFNPFYIWDCLCGNGAAWVG